MRLAVVIENNVLNVAPKQRLGWAGPEGPTNDIASGKPNPRTELTLTDETRYTLLRRLEENPGASQRELARVLGISLGKTNYCLKALLDKGYIKATNFKNSNNKRGYLYQLTPTGIAAKSRATRRFLARKQIEYGRLAKEIEQLHREVNTDERQANG